MNEKKERKGKEKKFLGKQHLVRMRWSPSPQAQRLPRVISICPLAFDSVLPLPPASPVLARTGMVWAAGGIYFSESKAASPESRAVFEYLARG